MGKEKEIQRLKRTELLEILLELSKENENLKLQIEEQKKQIEEQKKNIDGLNHQLSNRKIELDKAGTIAEASFVMNGVFDSAEKAAQQYLDNLQELYEREKYICEQKEAEVRGRCNALIQETQSRCNSMKEETIKTCRDMEFNVKKQCKELWEETESKCQEREKAAKEKCEYLDQKAKDDVEKRWNEMVKRLDDFYTTHSL